MEEEIISDFDPESILSAVRKNGVVQPLLTGNVNFVLIWKPNTDFRVPTLTWKPGKTWKPEKTWKKQLFLYKTWKMGV